MDMLVMGIGSSGNKRKQTTVNCDYLGGRNTELSMEEAGSREFPFTL